MNKLQESSEALIASPIGTVASPMASTLDPLMRFEEVPMELIEVLPQVRKTFDPERIREMVESIDQGGLLQPIRLIQEGTRYLIEDGERRYRAFCLMGRKTIPANIVAGPIPDGHMTRNQLIANCQRADLNPIEIALGIHKLMNLEKCNATEAAVKLGMSNAKVSRLLALLSLPNEIQKQVITGAIPSSGAYKLCQIEDRDLQFRLAASMATGEMTRDDVGRTVKARNKPEQPREKTAVKRAVAQLGQGRSVTVIAESLSMDSYIEILAELLAQAKRMKDSGIEVQTFCQMVSDKSQAA